MKSFIETQKALLTEIQNGCKRNFVLAREKEEKEQKLQQSASMPEITVTEPLEEGAAEDGGQNSDAGSTPEEGEEVGEAPLSQENGTADKSAVDGNAESSDSDTDTEEEEEEEERLAAKAPAQTLSSPAHVGGLPKPCCSPEQPTDALRPESQAPPLNAAEELKCDSRGGAASAAPPQASSPGNERRIAVSSPGRGHKIFVVTRVESLPEEAGERGARQECPLRPAALPQPGPPAPPAETDCSGALPGTATPPASSEPPPSVPSCGAGKEEVDSGLCERAGHGVALPNGLKAEFARALPDVSLGRDTKLSSCSVEHGKPGGAPCLAGQEGDGEGCPVLSRGGLACAESGIGGELGPALTGSAPPPVASTA